MGLMSGTSADGIDAALIRTDGKKVEEFGSTCSLPYPPQLKKEILKAYGLPPTRDNRNLDCAITAKHTEIVKVLLETAKMKPEDIEVVGFHGQTIFHKPPQKKGEIGETHQIGEGALLAKLTGIPVVEQFRLNDMKHGGQGAPLVPVFHHALVANLPKPLSILNIGGVGNITWIGEKDTDLIAFDTGPGNALIDDWVRMHTNLHMDEGGKIAAIGKVDDALLKKWLSHPYFKIPAPKSLDREAFKGFLSDLSSHSLEDGVATLTALTAATIQEASLHVPHTPLHCLVSGGGMHNPSLLKMIEAHLTCSVQPIESYGFAGDFLEAQAFAFLAVRALQGLPLSFPGTTGVSHPVTGGIICKSP